MKNYANENEILYHVNLNKTLLEGAEYAVLPGDPGRASKIASVFDECKKLAENREYTSYLSYHNNIPILICSTGMGGPSTAICIEELARLGIKYFIRIGTTGAIQKGIDLGDVIINNAAVRLDGTSKHYAPECFPAVADLSLTNKLIESAKKADIPYHVGLSLSSDSFWPGQERYDSFTGYILPEFQGSLSMWQKLGILNCEMETAALFTVTKVLGLSATSLCGVVVSRLDGEEVSAGETNELAQERTFIILKKFFENLEMDVILYE